MFRAKTDQTGQLLILVLWADISVVILAASRENLTLGFPTRSDINRAVQPQKMARDLKFRI